MAKLLSNRELILKSLWHAGLAGVGIYELLNPKPKSRVFRIVKGALTVGLIAFHIDAARCDIVDKPTVLQSLLYKLGGRNG
jgi:hypothetical protein